MHLKQIACLYVVLRVSHVMAMSKNLVARSVNTDGSKTAEKQEFQKEFRRQDGMTDIIFKAKSGSQFGACSEVTPSECKRRLALRQRQDLPISPSEEKREFGFYDLGFGFKTGHAAISGSKFTGLGEVKSSEYKEGQACPQREDPPRKSASKGKRQSEYIDLGFGFKTGDAAKSGSQLTGCGKVKASECKEGQACPQCEDPPSKSTSEEKRQFKDVDLINTFLSAEN